MRGAACRYQSRKSTNLLGIPMFRTCKRESPSVLEAVPLSTEKEKAIAYVSDESTPREAHPEVVGHDVRD